MADCRRCLKKKGCVSRGTVINKITFEKIKTVPLFGIAATLVSWALRKGYEKEYFFLLF